MAGNGKKQDTDIREEIGGSEHQSEDISESAAEDTVVQNEVDPTEALESVHAGSLNAETGHTPKSRSGGFLTFLTGGVVAAAIGFLLAQYQGGSRWPFSDNTSATDEFRAQISEQAEIISMLELKLSAAERRVAEKLDAPTLEGILSEQRIKRKERDEAFEASLAAVESRLLDLENRPIPDVGATRDAVESYSKELAAMREMFQTELQKIEAEYLLATENRLQTSTISQNGLVASAMSELRAAAVAGQPFSGPLAILTDAGVEISTGLLESSQTGIPTLENLKGSYPAAARAALANAAKNSDESGGIGAFLRSQLGMRSLKPREGEDVDAILSRAEAEVSSGNLTKALVELDSLQGAARTEMADWVELTLHRQAILSDISNISTIGEE